MITKFKSKNLLGETRKKENQRILQEKIKSILKGESSAVRREIRRGGSEYLRGTSAYQRKLREDILKLR